MLGAIVDVENDRHLRIEAGDTERREIWLRIKYEAVCAIRHGPIHQKEWLDATVRVGQSKVTANATGLQASNGGQTQSYGNNNVSGNTNDGTISTTVALQ